ncbi:hypothetical protein Pint_20274 [Pistacia integerrima]|uniref:Uncharacterized protein n=1 Tax=Pistacia integerrima TaxID=434235 RepID=A0ACC0X8F3_9ROSI|nr:hypothetical protein Pint_20274 [Pistacia integerrima]
MKSFLLAFVLLALASSLASAFDPSPLQDFCVAVDDPLHAVFVNGKFCKDPKLAKAWDFYFSVKMPGDTNNPVGSNVSAMNVDKIPGLNCWRELYIKGIGVVIGKPPTGESHSDSLFSDFTAKMIEALTKVQTPTPTMITEPSAAPIGITLNETNYALWSQVVEMYISGKDKLEYINGDIPQPSLIDPKFCKWRTDNAIVKGWLINSMDPSLIGNFIRFPMAKLVWDSIATTYFDGSDTSQVYDLRRRVTRLKQAGGSLEKYYNDL